MIQLCSRCPETGNMLWYFDDQNIVISTYRFLSSTPEDKTKKKYDGLRQDETWNYNSYFKMPNIASDSAGGVIYLEAQSNVLNIKIL